MLPPTHHTPLFFLSCKSIWILILYMFFENVDKHKLYLDLGDRHAFNKWSFYSRMDFFQKPFTLRPFAAGRVQGNAQKRRSPVPTGVFIREWIFSKNRSISGLLLQIGFKGMYKKKKGPSTHGIL